MVQVNKKPKTGEFNTFKETSNLNKISFILTSLLRYMGKYPFKQPHQTTFLKRAVAK